MNEEQKSPVMEGQKSSPTLGVVIGLVVVLVAGGLIYSRNKTPTAPTTPATPTTTDTDNRPMMDASSTRPTAPTSTSFDTYKDGTYTAVGEYQVPKGPEKITITLTIKGNKVTDSKFASTPNFPFSQKFMDLFSQNYQSMVVGKNINEIHLDKVSGSSLTPIGFNNALEKIKQEAGVSS